MKKGLFGSLKTILSSFVVGMLALLVFVLIVISYNAAYRSVEGAYLNQLQNFNKDIELQLVNFYNQQVDIAKFLARDDRVVNAVRTGSYGMARNVLEGYCRESKLVENVFISTAGNNSTNMVDGIGGKSVGTRWQDIEGAEGSLKNALNGKVTVSRPAKSPVTGMPYVLVSVPIREGSKISGILGYVLDVGSFAYEMVKKVKIGKTGYLYLCDKEGMVFAHPQKNIILNHVSMNHFMR